MAVALTSGFMPLLNVFGKPPSSRSAMNPGLVSYNLPSSRSPITAGIKNVVTKCSSANNASLDATLEDARPEVKRHFHPSVWDGHDFTSISSKHLIDEGRLKELKKEVKNMFSLAAGDSFRELDLIDKIQRHGVAYHFVDEIQHILQQADNDDYTHFFDQNICKNEHADLYYVSLRFRLLRQAGYYVSTDVFKKFKNEKGEFHANLASNVQTMLSLYEASYLGFRGEDIMDEAMAFSTKHLNSMLTSLSSPLALQVQHALKMPLQRIPERVYARYYIPIYEQDISRNKALMEFAKLDFNSVQLLHRNEINEVQGWWERMNIRSKLQYDVRDRVVEAYAMTNNIYFEPQFSQARIHLAKLWVILTVVDDTYDVFGNIDELGQLCDAFQRWDVNCTSHLSDAMKLVFLEVLNLFNDIETDMIMGGNVAGVLFFKKEIQDHSKKLLKEVKVIFSESLPTLEKWLSVSIPTAGINPFLIMGTMHSGATKEVYDWIASRPKVLDYSDMFLRLVGDIGSLKPEQARGTNCSCVPCYMMEHGVSELEAIEGLQKIISSLWKVMNEEGLRVHPVPMRVLRNALNFNRTISLYWDGMDSHTVSNERSNHIITSLFIDPI